MGGKAQVPGDLSGHGEVPRGTEDPGPADDVAVDEVDPGLEVIAEIGSVVDSAVAHGGAGCGGLFMTAT